MVTATVAAIRLASQRAEQPVRAAGAEHEVDPAAALAQRLGEREQRRAAVAAADQRRAAPASRGSAERPAQRADDVDRRRAACRSASHAVPAPCTAKTNSTVPP